MYLNKNTKIYEICEYDYAKGVGRFVAFCPSRKSVLSYLQQKYNAVYTEHGKAQINPSMADAHVFNGVVLRVVQPEFNCGDLIHIDGEVKNYIVYEHRLMDIEL